MKPLENKVCQHCSILPIFHPVGSCFCGAVTQNVRHSLTLDSAGLVSRSLPESAAVCLVVVIKTSANPS